MDGKKQTNQQLSTKHKQITALSVSLYPSCCIGMKQLLLNFLLVFFSDNTSVFIVVHIISMQFRYVTA